MAFWRAHLVKIGAALFLVAMVVAGSAWFITTQPEQAEALGIRQFASKLGLVSESLCATPCQGCYCDSIINGTCYVNGNPSGCIGCAGACTGDNDCSCKSGRGGCGARLAWCRDSDCKKREKPTSTPPPPTPTPVPPVCDDGATYVHIEEPAADWYHEPDYPVAVHQDPQFRGFDIVINASGGFAERREIKLEQLCQGGAGIFPEDCPNASWRWSCEEHVLEHHDDPLVKIELPMRLADSTVE